MQKKKSPANRDPQFTVNREYSEEDIRKVANRIKDLAKGHGLALQKDSVRIHGLIHQYGFSKDSWIQSGFMDLHGFSRDSWIYMDAVTEQSYIRNWIVSVMDYV